MEEAVNASSQGLLFQSALTAQGNTLPALHDALEADGLVRTNVEIEVTDTLVTYNPTDSSVTVRATIDGSYLEAPVNPPGGEEGTPSSFSETTDYILQPTALQPETAGARITSETVQELAQLKNGAAVDNPKDGTSALPAGEIPEPGDFPELPTENPGSGSTTPSRTTAAARPSFNQAGAAAWAVNNFKVKKNYGQDCTNFVSKALHYGGGLSIIRGYSRLPGTTYGSESDWRNWFGAWRGPSYNRYWRSSRSWRLVQYIAINLGYHRARVPMTGSGNSRTFKWRSSLDDIRVGDIAIWREKGASGSVSNWVHITIITKIDQWGIYHTSHTRDFVNENLKGSYSRGYVAGYLPILD